jgi:hypothetical protein
VGGGVETSFLPHFPDKTTSVSLPSVKTNGKHEHWAKALQPSE